MYQVQLQIVSVKMLDWAETVGAMAAKRPGIIDMKCISVDTYIYKPIVVARTVVDFCKGFVACMMMGCVKLTSDCTKDRVIPQNDVRFMVNWKHGPIASVAGDFVVNCIIMVNACNSIAIILTTKQD